MKDGKRQKTAYPNACSGNKQINQSSMLPTALFYERATIHPHNDKFESETLFLRYTFAMFKKSQVFF